MRVEVIAERRASSRTVVGFLVGATMLIALSPAQAEDGVTISGADLDHAYSIESEGSLGDTPLIWGGSNALNPGWIAAVLKDGSYICTGSLIDPLVVLTAAHCADSPGSYVVRVGAEDRLAPGTTRAVKEIHIHPEYGGDFINDPDLALLVLNARIEGIPLAPLNQIGHWPEIAQPLAIVGWGRTFDGGPASRYLQTAGVYATSGMDGAYDPVYCDLPFSARTVGGTFCYGGPVSAGTCRGDSGGPVVGWPTPSSSSGELTVYGVVSYGIVGCGPSTYDDKAWSVGGHYSWIRSVVDAANPGNTPPRLTSYTIYNQSLPAQSPHLVGESLVLEVAFDDPDISDNVYVNTDWGDGSGLSTSGEYPAGIVRSYHMYEAPGVFEVSFTIFDSANSSDGPFTFEITVLPDNRDRLGSADRESGTWTMNIPGEYPAGWPSFYFGDPGDYAIVGDWDCDGTDTPGLYRRTDGFVYLRNSNTQGVADVRFFFGNPDDIPLAGDFDGDGCDTVSIYRPQEARIFITNELGSNDGGLGAADYDFYFGDPGDKPYAGDFDGDGIDTVGLHRESTGLVYYRNSNTTGIAHNRFVFGDPGDRMFAGDWTGDGIDTPGLYRKTNGYVYLKYTNATGPADAESPYMVGGDQWPIAGAFNR